jgi:hypothetical protein
MNGRASEISVKNPAESPFLNSLLGPRAPAEGGDLIAHCIPHSFIACHKRSAVVGLRIVIDRGGERRRVLSHQRRSLSQGEPLRLIPLLHPNFPED